MATTKNKSSNNTVLKPHYFLNLSLAMSLLFAFGYISTSLLDESKFYWNEMIGYSFTGAMIGSVAWIIAICIEIASVLTENYGQNGHQPAISGQILLNGEQSPENGQNERILPFTANGQRRPLDVNLFEYAISPLRNIITNNNEHNMVKGIEAKSLIRSAIITGDGAKDLSMGHKPVMVQITGQTIWNIFRRVASVQSGKGLEHGKLLSGRTLGRKMGLPHYRLFIRSIRKAENCLGVIILIEHSNGWKELHYTDSIVNTLWVLGVCCERFPVKLPAPPSRLNGL